LPSPGRCGGGRRGAPPTRTAGGTDERPGAVGIGPARLVRDGTWPGAGGGRRLLRRRPGGDARAGRGVRLREDDARARGARAAALRRGGERRGALRRAQPAADPAAGAAAAARTAARHDLPRAADPALPALAELTTLSLVAHRQLT